MTTALERLQGGHYNSNPVSGGNPGGMADGGHVINFPAAMEDIGEVGAAAAAASTTATDQAELATEAQGVATAKAAEATAAAATATTKAGEAFDDAATASAAAATATGAATTAVDAAETATDKAAEATAGAATATTKAGEASDDAAAASADAGTASGAAATAVAAADTATDKAAEAVTAAGQAGEARDEAQDLRDQTEVLKNQAAAIVGGDFQPNDATLDALSALNATAGVIEQTGPDTFTKRAIGTAADTDLLTKGGAAGLFRTEAQVSAAISTAIDGLIDGAPGAINTLNELAAALGDDPNFASTVLTAVAGKLSKTVSATARLLGRASAGAGDAEELTAAQVKVILGLVIGDIPGLQGALDAKATAAQIRAVTDDTVKTTAKGLGDAEAWVNLGDVSGTITLDLHAGRNFKMRAIGNITFADPANKWSGFVGIIKVVQDGTGGRTGATNSAIKKTAAITLSSAANAVDQFTLWCDGAEANISPLLKGFA